jgi:hypothetical protein
MKVGDLVRFRTGEGYLYIITKVEEGTHCQLGGVQGWFSTKDGLEVVNESR